MLRSASARFGTRLSAYSILSLLHLSASAADFVAESPLPDPLRLADVTEIAQVGRAEVTAARARAEAFGERPAIVGALEDPMISPAIDHYPFDEMREQGEMGEPVDAGRYDWSISLEQRFPLSGIRGHRRAAARADAERAQAIAGSTQLDVVLDARRSFFMLLERRRMDRVLEEQIDLAGQLVSSSSSRYSSGTGTQSDLLRAEVEVARLQAARQALVAQVRASEAMLNSSLGRAPHERVPELEHSVSRDAPMPIEAAIEHALTRRPELLAGSAEIDRATAEIEVMRAMYKPMAMVRIGRASTMAEGPGAMIMIGVSLPIWRNSLRAGVAEARAMQRMADADLVAMRRMVEGEAVAARENVEAARTLVVVLESDVMPRARAGIEAALAGYSSGQGTLVSVVEAARALWDIQEEYVMAETALGEAWVRLDRAIGAKRNTDR